MPETLSVTIHDDGCFVRRVDGFATYDDIYRHFLNGMETVLVAHPRAMARVETKIGGWQSAIQEIRLSELVLLSKDVEASKANRHKHQPIPLPTLSRWHLWCRGMKRLFGKLAFWRPKWKEYPENIPPDDGYYWIVACGCVSISTWDMRYGEWDDGDNRINDKITHFMPVGREPESPQ